MNRALPAATVLCGVVVIGCGGSTENAMMAQAKAKAEARRAEREEEQLAGKPSPEPVAAAVASSGQSAPPQAAKPAAAGAGDVVAEKPAADVKAASPVPEKSLSLDDLAVEDVSQRKPSHPLSDAELYAMRLDNFRLVGEAFRQVNADRIDLEDIKAGSGKPLLSWRVRLLPALGHDDLYQMFRLDEPWNSAHNKQLLPRIPAAYLSPERFDEKTNLLAFIGFRLAGGTSWRTDDVSEALIAVEVNNNLAVPWTKPGDYEVDSNSIGEGIGALDEQGTLAVTHDGEVFLIPTGFNQTALYRACLIQEPKRLTGLGLKPAPEPAAVPVPDAAMDVAATTSATSGGPAVASAAGGQGMPMESASADDVRPTRETASATSELGAAGSGAPQPRGQQPVPNSKELQAANGKLREMFRELLSQAKTPADRVAVGEKMLEQSDAVRGDPAGLYALLQAVRNVAISAGNFPLTNNAGNLIKQSFDVDQRQLDLDTVRRFGATAYSPHRYMDVSGFSILASAALRESMVEDDYPSATLCANFIEKMIPLGDTSLSSEAAGQLNRNLTIAQNKYKAVLPAINALQDDPSNPQAAQAVGIYFCFVKGNWEEGIPVLRLAADQALSKVAVADAEAQRGGSPTAMVQAGDAWWAISAASKDPLISYFGKGRALHWYRRALPQLGQTLDRLRANSRVQESSEAIDGSLVESIVRITQTEATDDRNPTGRPAR